MPKIPTYGPRTKISFGKKKKKKSNAAKIANLNKKMAVSIDQGIKDTAILNNVSSTASFDLLNGLAQGDGEGSRSGREVYMESLFFRLSILLGDTTNIVRLLVVFDKQPNGAIFADTDLFETGGDPLENYNKQETKRFRVLFNKTYNLTSSGGNQQILVKKFIDFTRGGRNVGLKTMYNQNTSTIDAISTGSLYLYAVSDSGAATHPLVQGNVRLRFIR